jgi:cytochrome c peroxidase
MMLIPANGSLEAQAVLPIMNTSEMACEGRSWQSVTNKLERAKPLALASQLPADLQDAQSRAPSYSPLFERAFGDAAITPARIAMAIATYERTLTANQTPWDRWQAGDPTAMNEQEKRGFQLLVVKGLCVCCHAPPLFSGTQLFDDGFHEHSFDGGAAQVGGMPGDYPNPQFRTVSIRNAALREPAGLLHDGLVPGTSLEDLVAAYNKEPVHSVSVCRRSLGMSAEEQVDLIAFIRGALTDPRAAMELPPFDRPKLASER